METLSHEMGVGENRTKGNNKHERKIGINVSHQKMWVVTNTINWGKDNIHDK